jgi:hypothetical protein
MNIILINIRKKGNNRNKLSNENSGGRKMCWIKGSFYGLALVLLFSITAETYVSNQPADIVVGQPNMSSNAANQGGSAAANTLILLHQAIIFNNQLRLVDSWNHRVLMYNGIPASNNAAASIVIGQSSMTGSGTACSPFGYYDPCGLFFHNDGRLMVTDIYNHRVLIYNQVPTVNGASANIVIGQPDMYSGNSNCTSRDLNWPTRVTSDGTKMIIADEHNHRVIIFNQIPTTNYAAANVVVGQTNMTSNLVNQGGSAGANTFYYPFGVNVYGGRLFVADSANCRILIFNQIPTTNNASADIVIGQPNMSANIANQGGAPGANTLSSPEDVCYDGSKLFIADTQNNRVLVFNQIPTSNNASADVVLGQPNMGENTANNGGVSASSLYCPSSVFSDGVRLVVTDRFNNRALIYYNVPPTPTETPTISPTVTITPTTTMTPTITRTPTITTTPVPTPGHFARPNPFRPKRGQIVDFNFSGGARFTVRILNIRGRLVRTLSDTDTWDGRNQDGEWCESGVYIYQIESGHTRENGTIVVIQ